MRFAVCLLSVLALSPLGAQCDSTTVAAVRAQTDAIRLRHTATTTTHNNATRLAAARIDTLVRNACAALPAPPPAPPTDSLPPDVEPGPGSPPSPGTLPRLGVAEPPRVRVDPTRPTGPFTPVVISSCAAVQSAINGASRPAEILLAPGLDCAQTLVLPPKPGNGWILIRTASYVHVPGVRMTPTRAGALQLATFRAPANGTPVLDARAGAQRYRVEGVRFTAAAGVTQITNLVALGDYNAGPGDSLTADLQLIGSYVHGRVGAQYMRRCVMLHAVRGVLEDSWVEDCFDPNTDAQAVAAWNTPGPLRIVNNHLSATAEGFMLGGSDPAWGTFGKPRDVEIGRNHIQKPAAWCSGPPPGVIKNGWEIKGAGRAYIYENVVDGACVGGQTGGGVVIKTSCRGCSTHDITVVDMLVRNVGEFGSISGPEGLAADSTTRRITWARVAYEGAFNVTPWRGGGRGLLIYPQVRDVELVDSRFADVASTPLHMILIGDPGTPMHGLRLRNVVFKLGVYGFWTPRGSHLAGWNAVGAATGVWESVTIVGTAPAPYPPGTTFLSSVAAAGTAGLDLAALRARLAAVVVTP